jgi:hypothetical protein
MPRNSLIGPAILVLALRSLAPATACGQAAKLVERAPDPHGSPRPFRDARDVPLRTSLYLELVTPPGAGAGLVAADSVLVSLQPDNGEAIELLRPGSRFTEGASGWLRPKNDLSGSRSLAVYIEPPGSLRPVTRYTATVRASAGRAGGSDAAAGSVALSVAGTWSFTTEAAEPSHQLAFSLDLAAEPVQWHGRFFSGICNVVFCSQAAKDGPTYELMAEARKQHPRAWSFQRDYWPTGTEFGPPSSFLANRLPNIVRERETRRITAIEPREGSALLRVEDFFGHAQYGIPAGRSVAEDYHPGDQVLIADGIHDARSTVLAADGPAGTVTVAPFAAPPGGWKIAYDGALPDREIPDAPGLFPPGGCDLRKFRPHGTPCYFWGRLDKEFDLIHRRYGRRLMVNFADATGDLARDGRSWTTAKDLGQWHEVARTIAGHVIDRYGADALEFTWSVFNEPDLGVLFWRATWDELQEFYDYTTDAILRAFEDRGYNSGKVFIGGLELGGIFGTNLRLREFLAHCSPRPQAPGAAPRNAAVADQALDGKRSRRVEALCRAHGGKGSPCDFVSIHSYNRSEMMAAKLIRAKEMALEIDPDYYAKLWINSHEACPDWMPPPDLAAADSYLGDGYFPGWCADVVHRQLLRAASDSRYAYGESILTVWPPPVNFAGLNAVTRVLQCDQDGDGSADQEVTVPMPIFHALGMLSDLGDRYWVLPDRAVGGHVVSGFASRDDRGVVRALLYAHHARDTQSRSEATFEVALDLGGLGGTSPVSVREYRFDRDHNSPFRLMRALRDRMASAGPSDSVRQASALRALEGGDLAAQRQALATVEKLGPATVQAVAPALMKLAGEAKDPSIREAAREVIRKALAPPAYSRAEVEEIRRACECRPTAATVRPRETGGRLRLSTKMAGNGCTFLIIEPR